MASKLNPGADETLVNVAYRAAMTNTPGDYSDTLEKAAESYGKTMEASAKMWKDVATVGAAVGNEMVKNSKEWATMAAEGAALDSEGATFLEEEVYALKDEIKALGFLPNLFGDRETRQEKARLKSKQAELFAEIDAAGNSIAEGVAAIAAGTYDSNLGNIGQDEMINAIVKSNLKNKITGEGNYAKLSRDEKTGELMYTLYKENGSLATLTPGGEAQTMTIGQFNDVIANNKKDGGVMLNGLNTRNDGAYNRGLKSINGVYAEEMRQADLNYLDSILGDNPINLKRAMHTTFGYSNTSFYDDVTDPLNGVNSEFSADLYGTLLKVTGGGDALTGGITEGMVDTDGEEGISAQEAMNSKNYQILTANLLGLKDPKVTKAYFKDYTAKNFQAAFEYGHGNKKPKPGSGTGTDVSFVNLRSGKSSNIGANTGNGYVPNSALNTIGKSINDRDIIDLGDDKFIWDNDKKAYTLDGETINNKYSLFSTIYGENFDPANIISMYNGIEDWTVDTRQSSSFDEKTNLSIGLVAKKDEDVASDLNDIIPPKADDRNPRNLGFEAVAALDNIVALKDDFGKTLKFPKVYPKGHEKAGEPHPRAGTNALFFTKGNTTENTKNLASMIDILKVFGLYDNISKQLP